LVAIVLSGIIMLHDYFDQQLSPRSMRSRLRYGKRRVQAEIRVESFPIALANFSRAAEAFALSLNDAPNRNFAFRYAVYLQDIAHEVKAVKPHEFGLGPAARLIRAELDRLFDVSFLSTDRVAA
jgi:hypothetical protein